MSEFTNLLRLVAFDVSEQTAKTALKRAADQIDKQDTEIERLKAEIECKDTKIAKLVGGSRINTVGNGLVYVRVDDFNALSSEVEG